jgi:hypothetical protein
VEISSRAGVAQVLFIFGTTFLWLTPAFLGSAAKADGSLWTAVPILSLLTIVSFAVAATWNVALPSASRDHRRWAELATRKLSGRDGQRDREVR